MKTRSLLFGIPLLLTACSDELPVARTQDPKPVVAAQNCSDGAHSLRRLNRAEYDNTVRDLLGETGRPATTFPADPTGHGFDNEASLLGVSPALVEAYEATAGRLIDQAWARDGAASAGGGTVRIEAESASATTGASEQNGTVWNLWSNGDLSATFTFAQAGEYQLSVRAWGTQAPPDPVRMQWLLDGVVVASLDVPATTPTVYTKPVRVDSPGQKRFTVRFTNDIYDPDTSTDRNLLLDWMEVRSPAPTSAATQRHLRVCEPAATGEEACARQMVESLANRAWRRPAKPDEVAELMSVYTLVRESGDGFELAAKFAFRSVLLSPHFLFQVVETQAPGTGKSELSARELASRLSYFLWSSQPDAELTSLADAGRLSDPEVLEAQVRRMLKDPRSEALVQNFAGQWLGLRKVDGITADPTLFPGMDSELKRAMREEGESFFRAFLNEDRSALELLDAEFTYVNDRLADYYGLPRPGSASVTRVSTGDGRRGGVLGQAGVLAQASLATRTSPVLRGKWVLGKLLCQEPPPPPPGVEALPTQVPPGSTLRQITELHRANPACAGCHDTLDPIGFGLENYDAAGAWRETDNGSPVDATGNFKGVSFQGPRELATILKGDPAFATCMTRQALAYGLGRALTDEDEATVRYVDTRFSAGGHRLPELLVAVALSDSFRNRCPVPAAK
ncbi:hypothetical protein BHS09_18890 [Myxococcus xanthus]|uniref:DUF1592 domain-containing protein n=1 Tax=Myxococcus xanthus TaxID=34 RepID=A0AAE6G199_MYXXA|nr:DUF1592 domain-containing protein [Myxococcus xanthus]QDE68881.1 hypothetical protein BHS09_18890 [Myxococcus xanthus]QDE76157.1 hypothetical protein BHS08_18905 [Myxococcus xanthus]